MDDRHLYITYNTQYPILAKFSFKMSSGSTLPRMQQFDGMNIKIPQDGLDKQLKNHDTRADRDWCECVCC